MHQLLVFLHCTGKASFWMKKQTPLMMQRSTTRTKPSRTWCCGWWCCWTRNRGAGLLLHQVEVTRSCAELTLQDFPVAMHCIQLPTERWAGITLPNRNPTVDSTQRLQRVQVTACFVHGVFMVVHTLHACYWVGSATVCTLQYIAALGSLRTHLLEDGCGRSCGCVRRAGRGRSGL